MCAEWSTQHSGFFLAHPRFYDGTFDLPNGRNTGQRFLVGKVRGVRDADETNETHHQVTYPITAANSTAGASADAKPARITDEPARGTG